MTHTITFRRPELPYVLSTMFVPAGADAEMQVRHLEDLGYKIITVSPPLDICGPSQDLPELREVTAGKSVFRRGR